MHLIRIFQSGDTACTEIRESGISLLSQLLIRYGISAAFPCGGRGTCGKCKVRAVGALSPISKAERSHLTAEEISRNLRLACYCSVSGDAEIHLDARDEVIVDRGDIRSCYPIPADNGADTMSSVIHTGGRPSLPAETGVACDIGTTAIALRLYDLSSDRLLAKAAEPNSQRIFGADVISRITACDEQGTERLSTLIFDQISRMVRQCLNEADLTKSTLKKTVLTGNTTMLHIWEGLNPHSLAVSPFTLQSPFGRLSRKSLEGCPVYLPECVGAYVGADVLCAALASGMLSNSPPVSRPLSATPSSAAPGCRPFTLLVDIGTNGEMALALPDGTFLCCSAPAGPAFEGAGISMGMNASPGAVSAVRLDENDAVTFHTIGNLPASGLCGSGLIDCVAVMKTLGIIDDTGYLKGERFKLPGTCVSVTQADIRQVQLAKGAVRAGINALLYKAGIPAKQIAEFYIAGGFGSFLNLQSACQLGLFPPELLPAAAFVGNAALEGSALILLNDNMRQITSASAAQWHELHLASDPFFMDEFVRHMEF